MGQIEREGSSPLRGIQRKFEPAARQLRRPRSVIGRVESAYQFCLVFLGHQPLDGRPGAILFLELVLQPQVPEVCPIQRQTDCVVPSPEQPAQQSVAQRDCFVPRVDGGGKLEVERSGRQKWVGFLSRPSTSDRQPQSRETQNGKKASGSHGLFPWVGGFRTKSTPRLFNLPHWRKCHSERSEGSPRNRGEIASLRSG